MTNLQRLTGKIFGETATAIGDDPQIGQFGSALNGTYVGTTDVATIQSLPAWSNGFIDSVTPNEQFPPLPEMTGFGKVLSYQTAYTLQKGVPEWDAGTTYYIGDICKGIGEGKLYVSKIDNNLNNALTDANSWEEFSSGSSRNIGEVVVSTIPLTDAGLHLLDGALISGSGSYSAFVSYMADLYNSGDYSARFTTEANWQASVASNGLCSQFVYDSVNNTVRLPKWGNIAYTKQYTLTLASYVPVRGNGIALGITNGTDLLGLSNSSPNGLSVYTGLYGKGVGATWSGTHPTVANLGTGVTTDGTKSGLIAETSGVAGLTNDPLSCYYYIVVATSTKTDIEVDIDEIATDLNGKADVDLTNLSDTGKIANAHNAMPSGTYKSYTLGASGSSYTATADGWITCRLNSVTMLQLYSYTGNNTFLCAFGNNSTATYLACTLPVSKGKPFTLSYAGGTPSDIVLRLYYANGSTSEPTS